MRPNQNRRMRGRNRPKGPNPLTRSYESNGPDVNIYLVAAPDVQKDATVKDAGFVTLGPIKGNKGDQNYELPSDVDLGKYKTVTV